MMMSTIVVTVRACTEQYQRGITERPAALVVFFAGSATSTMAAFEIQYPNHDDDEEHDDEDEAIPCTVVILYPTNSSENEDDESEDRYASFPTLRSFAEFLDQSRVVHSHINNNGTGTGDGDTDNPRPPLRLREDGARVVQDGGGLCRFEQVQLILDPTTASSNAMRGFSFWLDENARRSNTNSSSTTNSLCMTTRSLELIVNDLRGEDDERLPVLAQHGPVVLGHLRALGNPLILSLRMFCYGDRKELPPGLFSSWLDALPTCDWVGPHKTLSLQLRAFDASAAQALVRVLPHLRVGAIRLNQVHSFLSHPQIVSAILRAALDNEGSQISSLTMLQFNFSAMDLDVWDLFSVNRVVKTISLHGDLGRSAVLHLAAAILLLQQWTIVRRRNCPLQNVQKNISCRSLP